MDLNADCLIFPDGTRFVRQKGSQNFIEAPSPRKLRETFAQEPAHLTGLALRYHVRHERWGGQIVIHTALRESRSGVEIRVDHGREGFANTANGSARLINTAVGLFVQVHITNPHVRDLIAGYAEAGQLCGWSVGLQDMVVADGIVTRATLDEISLCVRYGPATDQTTVQWIG
jgi:hypothetical protein